MNLSHSRRIAIAMLVIFLTSLGSWSFSTRWLSPELGHVGQSAHLVLIDHASDQSPGDSGSADDDALSDAEHNLLHAASQLQPVPLSAFNWEPPTRSGAVRALFIPPLVAHATHEAPFRPPRNVLA